MHDIEWRGNRKLRLVESGQSGNFEASKEGGREGEEGRGLLGRARGARNQRLFLRSRKTAQIDLFVSRDENQD